MLAIEEDANRCPAQCLPRVKIVGLPDLDAIFSVLENQRRTLRVKALPRCREQFGQVFFQPRHDRQTESAHRVQEGGRGQSAIDDRILSKPLSEVIHRAPQQPLGRREIGRAHV